MTGPRVYLYHIAFFEEERYLEHEIANVASISAAEFSRLINDFSEDDGFFRSDNFVSNERSGIVRDWVHGAPDLAVEILSKGNTEAEMQRKVREYFKAGSRRVWIVKYGFALLNQHRLQGIEPRLLRDGVGQGRLLSVA